MLSVSPYPPLRVLFNQSGVSTTSPTASQDGSPAPRSVNALGGKGKVSTMARFAWGFLTATGQSRVVTVEPSQAQLAAAALERQLDGLLRAGRVLRGYDRLGFAKGTALWVEPRAAVGGSLERSVPSHI